MPAEQPTPEVDTRIETVTRGFDLHVVAQALDRQRTAILDAWLEVARRQPFHVDRPDAAVSDHLPRLLEALIRLLATPDSLHAPGAPMDDPAVNEAAEAHARMRFEQQLGPVAIATEFRLLRHEVARALARTLEDDVPTTDVVAALAAVNDALDGATAIALNALTERLETVREDFLATTVHDLRQPVTLIEGSLALVSRWLRKEPFDAILAREVVDGALRATLDVSQMVDTIADASRVALGAVELSTEPTTVREIIVAVLDAVEPERRARIDTPTDPGRDLVGEWDRQAIRRVVANVVSNALKYTPEGRPIAIAVERAGARARISVIDQGIGLLPDEIDVVFERYRRAEAARAGRVPGLGLGLYAARGLVAAHGGTITLESEGRDRGTTVRIELPLAPDTVD